MTVRPTLMAFGLGLLAAVATPAAHAEGDAARGKVLAYTCHGCHGIADYKNAYPTYSVPKLGGQHAAYIAAALKEYSATDRAHNTMHAQASSLSDQDRQDIAAFFQAVPVKSSGQVVGTPPAATAVCVACHGNDGAGLTADYPALAGQYEDYIEQALRDYKSGKRKNPIMAGIVTGIKDEDIPALAAFFSQQKGLCNTDQIRDHGHCK